MSLYESCVCKSTALLLVNAEHYVRCVAAIHDVDVNTNKELSYGKM
jgi:hypothetical protein